MTRVLVTGAAGLLGSWLVNTAPRQRGVRVHGTTRAEADLADKGAVSALFDAQRPDVVIHTASRVEDPELDIVLASANVVDACLAFGAGLVHISTDVVFDGEHGPYGEHDRPAPITPYGAAKAAVEADIRERVPDAAIVRTSLVCWHDPPDPRTAAVLDALRTGRLITLFTDELRCPVRVDDLAAALWELALLSPRSRSGVWHLVGPEAVSRYTLGVLIAAWAGLDPDGITAGTSASHPEPRPRDARLSTLATDVALSTPIRPISTLFARLPPPPKRGRRRA